MSRIINLNLRNGQAMINLDAFQSIQLVEHGIDVFMLDPDASFCIELAPADAKALYAKLFNAIFGMNTETRAALEALRNG